jgi:hypothetical protein
MTAADIYTAAKQYLACHPWVAGLLTCAEAAAAGTVINVIISGGFDSSPAGLKRLAAVVLASVVVAVRNYLKQSPLPAQPLAKVIPFPPPAAKE